MIPEGTEAAAVTEQQIRDVSIDVETFAKDHKISRREIGKAIGYSTGVISEFLAGKYLGTKGQLAIDLETWLTEEEQRRARSQTTQFVWTNVAQEMKAIAHYCLDYQKTGMVYGPDASGIGKTTAMVAIHQELGARRSTLVTIDKVDANPSGLLRKICRGIGRPDYGHNRERFSRIVEYLLGRSHLLMLDQAQNLRGAKDDKPFFILADIFDAAKTAQFWCATGDLVVYLQRQQTRNADESLAQIRRRIFPCVDLMESVRANGPDGNGELLVTVEQVREMFAKNRLKITHAAARFLTRICNWPDSGSVGLCVQIVEYATVIAEGRKLATIDVPQLQEALRRGLTPHRAGCLLQAMDIAEPQRIAKAG
jgi:hypothetical protein